MEFQVYCRDRRTHEDLAELRLVPVCSLRRVSLGRQEVISLATEPIRIHASAASMPPFFPAPVALAVRPGPKLESLAPRRRSGVANFKRAF